MTTRAQRSIRLAARLAVALGMAGAIGGCGRCARDAWPARVPGAPIRLALAAQPMSALAILAVDKGFFDAEGLAVVATEHPSGARALAALLAGDADVCTTADVPLVLESFRRPDMRILATIGSSSNEPRIVARRDRGIASPGDLRGRRVGTQKASAVHYFLHAVLLKYGMRQSEITPVFLKAEDLPAALRDGRVDAITMREPYVSEAVRMLGDQALVLQEPGLYLRIELLVALSPLAEQRPDAVQALLRALLRAEDFARHDPGEALAVVAYRLHGARSGVGDVWPELDLSVRLNQALFQTLEDAAMWAVRRGLAEGVPTNAPVPNYLGFLDLRGMDAVKPEAVTVIR